MQARALRPLKHCGKWYGIGEVVDIDDEALRAWEGHGAVEVLAASAPPDSPWDGGERQEPDLDHSGASMPSIPSEEASSNGEADGSAGEQEEEAETSSEGIATAADPGKRYNQLKAMKKPDLVDYAASIGLTLAIELKQAQMIEAIQAREVENASQAKEG